MKKFSKILSVALLVALVLSLGVASAFADNYPITINNANATVDHDYTAYQIFKGTLSTNESGAQVLANITWGDGVDGAALLTELKTITAYANCADAAAVADVLEGFDNNSAELEAFANIVGKHLAGDGISAVVVEGSEHKQYTVNATEPGYYIIKEGVNNETQRSASGFMINVVGPATANVKDNPMTPDKNILIATGQADAQSYQKVKENTANVGDTVTFVVDKITVPSTDGYKTFKFVMRDTLPKGLTFGEILSVKLDKTSETVLTAGTDYTATTTANADGSTELRVVFLNALTALKPYEGKEVEIKYTAVVNKDANFGNTGNENEVVFEFTNNPDDEHEGDDFGPNEPHGITPKSTTKTYVTKIVVKKVDGNKDALGGAVFTLAGTAKNVVVTTGQHFVKDANGTYYLLKDGTYTTTVPTNAIADKYQSSDKYKLEDYEREEISAAGDVVVEAVSDATTGLITYEGLKPGTYTLTETGAPVGYNKIKDPISFEIKFENHQFGFVGTKLPDGVTLKTDGTFEVEIENNSGATLPSTGGIGTTIFYVVGGVLVLAAIILLVTKKRMSE